MAFPGPTILLGLATLLLFAGALALRARGRLAARAFEGLLWVCLVAALVFHLGALRKNPDGGLPIWVTPAPHVHELCHYYLSTKYFAELGHLGVYDASVIADYEDTGTRFRPGNTFRDLRTNQLDRRRGTVIAEGSLAKRPFSPERWAAFKQDVAVMRTAYPADAWDRSTFQVDHGYNGSPLTTFVLGTLANQPFVSTFAFLSIIQWLDLILIGALGFVVSGAISRIAALEFLILFWLNPLNEYGYIGGSFLRYNYVLALAMAFLFWASDRRQLSAAFLALSTAFRLFPGGFLAALGLSLALRPQPVQALRKHLPLFATAAGTLALIAALTALQRAPGEQNAWSAFRERISTHSSGYAYNAIGASLPFGYVHSNRYAELYRRLEHEGENIDWTLEMHAAHERRAPLRIAVTLVLGLGVAALARRIALRDALFLGYPVMFLATELSSYYWASLGLLPLLLPHRRDVIHGFAALCALGLVTLQLKQWLPIGPDHIFQLFNLQIAAFLGYALWRLARWPSSEVQAEPVAGELPASGTQPV